MSLTSSIGYLEAFSFAIFASSALSKRSFSRSAFAAALRESRAISLAVLDLGSNNFFSRNAWRSASLLCFSSSRC